MIVVNNQSSDSAYWPLQHAQWNGWTPTDLIFPFFLFIVGVSLVFSCHTRLERGDSRRALVLHTIRRSAVLFAIGLALNGSARSSNWLLADSRGCWNESPLSIVPRC